MAIFSVGFDPVRGYVGRVRCWVRFLRALAVGTGAVVLGPGPGFCRSGGLSCFVFVVFVFFSVCLSPLVFFLFCLSLFAFACLVFSGAATDGRGRGLVAVVAVACRW